MTNSNGDQIPGWLKPLAAIIKPIWTAMKENTAGVIVLCILAAIGWTLYRQDERETRAELRERETRVLTMEGQQKIVDSMDKAYDRMEARREKFTSAQVKAISDDLQDVKRALDHNTDATNRAVDVFRGLKLAPKKTPPSNPNTPNTKGPKADPEVDEDFWPLEFLIPD